MSSAWRDDLELGYGELDAFPNLDETRLAVFRQYLAEEYAGPFVDGMGSYEILDMVRRFARPGRRLDVGGGTASLFWLLGTEADIRTTTADVEPEALAVLREFLAAPTALPECYYQAAQRFDIPPTAVERLRQSIDSYVVFNALRGWPAELTRSPYDLVTAFGCFAIAGTESGYRDCFRNAANAARAGGRLIGADWIRHAHRQTRDYSFVTTEVLARIGTELGLLPQHLARVAVRGHHTYGEVVLWAFEKP